VLELAAKHFLRVRAHPAIEDVCVDSAEVGGELHVAILEVRKAGVLAVDAAFDGAAGDEHHARGSRGRYLAKRFSSARRPNSEKVIRTTSLLRPEARVPVESGDRFGNPAEEIGMLIGLVGVRVEASDADVVNTRGQAADDSALGDGLKRSRKLDVLRVLGGLVRLLVVAI